MLVKDVMTENPITVSADTSVLDAREIMSKNRIKKLPVVDTNMTLIGLVTNTDLIKASPSQATTLDVFELGYLLSRLLIKDIMVHSVKTTTANQTVEEAARLMADYNISCLPVVKDSLLVGIVTETDLFAAFIEMFNTRTPGVRAVITVKNEPGEFAKVFGAIAKLNGNIVSLVTSDAEDSAYINVTTKVTNITQAELLDAAASCGARVGDIRSV